MLLVAKPPLKVALSNPKALLPASHRDRALLDAMSASRRSAGCSAALAALEKCVCSE